MTQKEINYLFKKKNIFNTYPKHLEKSTTTINNFLLRNIMKRRIKKVRKCKQIKDKYRDLRGLVRMC